MLTTSGTETDQARAVVRQATTEIAGWRVRLDDGAELTLPPELSALMTRVLASLARDGAVRVSALTPELTTSVAAQELGISRPTLMKKIQAEEIPAHKVGSHTRLRTSDVLAFKRARLARQRAALDELVQLEDQIERDHGVVD